ncbi:unnamed protein product [Pylaiella littoralis]
MAWRREQELERVGIDEPEAPRKVPKNEVSLDNANDPCWLVKCTPSVWKAWEGLEEGAKLGELVVKTVKRKKPDGSVVEEQTMQVKPGGLVTHFKGGAKAKLGDYWLSTERNIEDAVAFTRPKTGTTGSTAIVSTIKRQYLMQPEVGPAYTKVVKTRLVANTIKARTTEPVAMSEVYKAARDNMTRKGTAFDSAFHAAQQAKLEAKGEGNKGSREKLEHDELRSRLFGLFAKKDVYMLKELNKELQQSEKYLREMLQEIARMHTSGPHRNCWELKPEFKTSGEAPGGGAEGGDAKEPEKDA